MNQPDDLDAAIRAAGALAAPAPPPFDDVRRRARTQQRRRRVLAGGGAAAAVVAAAVTAALAGDDRSGRDDVVVDRPPATVVPDPVATGPRPDELVAVDAHGRLVVVDVAGGTEVRELDADGDPAAPPDPEAEIGANVLDDVAVAPDGTAYYTSVGEPVSGSVLRRAIDGDRRPGDGEVVGPGNQVAVRPDGRAVAGSAGVVVSIAGGGTGTAPTVIDAGDGAQFGAVAWSADGRALAVERTPYDPDGTPRPTRVAVLAVPGRGDQVVLDHEGGRAYTHPAYRADGRLVVAEQDWCPDTYPMACGTPVARVLDPATGEVVASFDYGAGSPVVDQSYDATGTWLLVTFADGTLRWYGGGGTGVVPGSYRAADW